MIRLIITILFLIVIAGGFALGKKGIDYTNKRIIKKISKIIDTKDFALQELSELNSEAYQFRGKFYQVIQPTNDSDDLLIYIGRVTCCRASGCSIERKLVENEESEYFDYFIMFDKNKNVIEVNIFNYQATYGYEITSKGWLKQFIGRGKVESFEVGKNIDAISGATISVHAITFDVQEKMDFLKQI